MTLCPLARWDGFLFVSLILPSLTGVLARTSFRRRDRSMIGVSGSLKLKNSQLISSIADRLPDLNKMPYVTMKAVDIPLPWSLRSLTRALAPYNLTVNCLFPKSVYTPLWEMGATARLLNIREGKAKGQRVPKLLLPRILKRSPRKSSG
jgi:hypothetical protein